MSDLSKVSVNHTTVEPDGENQRIDNFLIKRLKGVPKSHVYRILRSGEVRVNSRRVNADYRLHQGDRIRIPPIRIAKVHASESRQPTKPRFVLDIMYEDDAILVVNKPAGIAVHGGSGVSLGVIEQLRAQHPEWNFLELVHRLDRETSGVLLLAKKRRALTELHRQIREGEMEKHYLVLVKGKWRNQRQSVKLPLNKYVTASGERRVRVASEGLPAHTVFTVKKSWKDYSLLEAELKTGRTHQIRVHLAHLGFPIAGDDKYGNFALNKELAKRGLKRMFLHASLAVVSHPLTGEKLALAVPLSTDLQDFLNYIEQTACAGAGIARAI